MKILLVEDDKFFREFYAQKLREKGMEVFQAGNGDEGLAIVTQNMPDIILLDLIMPVKDGFEVLAELNKNEATKTIPVLIFSTLGQDKDVQKALSLGAKGYVNKSFFDFDTLFNKITELVGNNASQPEIAPTAPPPAEAPASNQPASHTPPAPPAPQPLASQQYSPTQPTTPTNNQNQNNNNNNNNN